VVISVNLFGESLDQLFIKLFLRFNLSFAKPY